MAMKIVAAVLTSVLVAALGVGAVFYLKAHKPLAEDHARMKAALPAYEQANAELKKLQGEQLKETAWLGPAVGLLNTGLAKEIASGSAEVFVAGNKVIVNISEQELFLPGAYTFAKESPILRLTLAALLKSDALKGKDIYIGNTTRAVPARGKGRKRVPAKDARTLGGERSAALVKNLEKNGVDRDAIIAAAFSEKQRVIGFKIKEQKSVIIIEDPPSGPVVVTTQVVLPQTAVQPHPVPIPPAQPITR